MSEVPLYPPEVRRRQRQAEHLYRGTGAHKKQPPPRNIRNSLPLGTYSSGPYGGPRGGAVSYERGTKAAAPSAAPVRWRGYGLEITEKIRFVIIRDKQIGYVL